MSQVEDIIEITKAKHKKVAEKLYRKICRQILRRAKKGYTNIYIQKEMYFCDFILNILKRKFRANGFVTCISLSNSFIIDWSYQE